jgi:hypothetical protein
VPEVRVEWCVSEQVGSVPEVRVEWCVSEQVGLVHALVCVWGGGGGSGAKAV